MNHFWKERYVTHVTDDPFFKKMNYYLATLLLFEL